VPEFSPKELEARGLQQSEIAKVEKSWSRCSICARRSDPM